MGRLAAYFAVFVISLTNAAYGQFDPYEAKRGYKGILYNTPVYDPHSKSYFELFGNVKGHMSYSGASKYARRKSFMGVRGRLAIIRSKKTQDFLVQTFKPRSETWIGLRMFCNGRVLLWGDGKKLDRRKDYANWGREWHYRSQYQPCKGRAKYAGVVLVRFEGRMRWMVIAPAHFVRNSFIEYPTGRR